MTYEELGINNLLYRTDEIIKREEDKNDNIYYPDSSTSSISGSGASSSETPSYSISSGELTGNLVVNKGFIRSANFVTGVSGWTINDDGTVEFESGNFRGDITGATGTFSGTVNIGSLNIPDTTTPSSFHSDSNGNVWWGTNVATGYATAPARILANGAAIFSSVSITGGSIAIGAAANSLHVDADGNMWLGAETFNILTNPFAVSKAGVLKATSGTIGGWTLGATTLSSSTLTLDSGNNRIRSSNYSTGVSGFTIEPTLIEAENIIARGTLRGTTFAYDVVSAIGGQLMVANADTLASDMTALDASTLTVKGDTTFAVNDILVIRGVATSGVQEEWLRVTNIGSAPTYTVIRDLAGSFGADANPVWKAGTPVVKQGSSNGTDTYSGGWLRLIGEGTNSPYYSVFKRTGVDYNDYVETCRLGNLNGFLDYTDDEYGIAIGSTSEYFKYDPTNGLRMAGNIQNLRFLTAGETATITVPTPVYIQTDLTKAEELDIDTGGSGSADRIYSSNWSAQTFTIENDKNTITKIILQLRKTGTVTGFTLTAGLYATSGGYPTGSALATDTLDAGTLTTSFTEYTFDFNYNVIPNGVYAVVVHLSDGNSSNYAEILEGSPYAGGKAYTSSGSGSSWVDEGVDYKIKVYESYINPGDVGSVILCDDTDSTKLAYTGMVLSSMTVSEDIGVQFTDVVSGYSGLSVGSTYYLNRTTNLSQAQTAAENADVNMCGINAGQNNDAKIGQTFTTDGNFNKLSYIKVKLKKTGSPTDNVQMKIYASDKTTLIATSTTTVPCSGLTGSNVLYQFDFTPVVLSMNTKYFIELSRTGAYDNSNLPTVAANQTSSSYSGGELYRFRNLTSAWVSYASSGVYDLYFICGLSSNNGITTVAGTNSVKVGRAISETELLIYQLAI